MDRDNSNVERRRYKRAKTKLVFNYQVNKPLYLRMMMGWNEEINALMLDLGEGGVSLLTKHDIPPSTIIIMRFVLITAGAKDGFDIKYEEEVKLMEAIGEVRYNLLSEGNEHRLGVHFTYILGEDKMAIADFVDKNS